MSENLRISEQEKKDNEIIVDELDNKINNLRDKLNFTKENSIEIRERKASSGATIDGLNKKTRSVDRVGDELSLNEDNLLEFLIWKKRRSSRTL